MIEVMGRYKGWKDVFVHLTFPADHETRRAVEESVVLPIMPEGYDAIARGKCLRRSRSNGWMVYGGEQVGTRS